MSFTKEDISKPFVKILDIVYGVEANDIIEQVINLAREGLLVPRCPDCGTYLYLNTEALAGKCFECESLFEFDDINWSSSSNFAKA